jgi:hypothetical protein
MRGRTCLVSICFPKHRSECNDDVAHGRPPNLEISLIAEIAGMAGSGWVNQDSASKSIYSVVC